MNVIVGSNEAGKSTLLEAINMALTGRLNGSKVSDALNPYWFNTDILDEFFDGQNSASSEPNKKPEFRIDLYLDVTQGELQKLRGINNLDSEDSVGLSIWAHPDPEYVEELEQYFEQEDCPRILPIEYYQVEWLDFSGAQVFRKPKNLGLALIDSRTIRSDKGMDYYTRQILEDRLDTRARNQVAVEHRKMRATLGCSVLEELNAALRHETESVDSPGVGVQVDQSRSASWETTLIPEINRIPFSMAGQGAQAFAKTVLAMGRTAESTSYVLIEEPENHLSHTRLRELLARITKSAGKRQVFITTHSSYVLNRLGLDQLVLISDNQAHRFDELNSDTAEYFRKLSGFDTLRILLAERIVLVEGPSDEIIFNRFFKDKYGKEPMDMSVDVMSINGVSFKRGLELAALVGRSMIALRDNDGKSAEYWKKSLDEYLKDGCREIFIGDPTQGSTLELQIIEANDENQLRRILNQSNNVDLSDWMQGNKTQAALRIAEASYDFTPPPYIGEAIDKVMQGTAN